MTTALVLLSGGQDSTTCLAWALARFDHVETIGFDYRQRHAVELDQRGEIRREIVKIDPAWALRLGQDHCLDLGVLGEISASAMTRDISIICDEKGLPNTFVPGRNLMFFTLAAAIASRRGLRHLVGGMCETDYSGYPDCRDDTLKAMQVALNLGMEKNFIIDTPLMWLDKGETWRLAETLGGKTLVDLIVETTHSCYLGERQRKWEWGYGCGDCPACRLRAEGWQKYRAGS
ncbi:MAG: 7-cyano-7-deazaguanine synthase QueC [Methylovirgula sp.]